eukprot:2050702-Rhodomonas_salina.1
MRPARPRLHMMHGLRGHEAHRGGQEHETCHDDKVSFVNVNGHYAEEQAVCRVTRSCPRFSRAFSLNPLRMVG